LQVERNHGRIDVASVLLLAAPRPLVYQALSDYDRFAELSRRYKQSNFVEPAADGVPRVYTEIEGCVWFFCRNVKRISRLELTPDEEIIAIAEPEFSDVNYGREQWQLLEDGAGTRVVYTHSMEFDFWVPPVIGVWAIKRALNADAQSAAERIEELALERAPEISP